MVVNFETELRSAHNQRATKMTHVARTSRTATVRTFLNADQTRLPLTAARGLAWVPEHPRFSCTMEFTFSLQRLAAYQPRKGLKSKETYDSGLALLERGGYAGKGEEGASCPNILSGPELKRNEYHSGYTCMCTQAGIPWRSSRSPPSTRTSSMWPTYVSLPLLALAPPPPPPPAPRTYTSAISCAQRCIKLLADKFPDSPRVSCLIGIRMEATEPPETALKYYDDLLETDPANSVCISSSSFLPSPPPTLSRTLRKTRRR